jgi:hypothetical protein
MDGDGVDLAGHRAQAARPARRVAAATRVVALAEAGALPVSVDGTVAVHPVPGRRAGAPAVPLDGP